MSLRGWTLQLVLFAASALPGVAPGVRAQITGDIEADIPFSFIVADTTLGPGGYVIRPLGGEDPAMEILRADGAKTVTVLITRSVGASLPPKTELIFRRYDNQEFLSAVLVEGNHEKAEIEPSRDELRLKKEGRRSQVHSIAARHQKTAFDPS